MDELVRIVPRKFGRIEDGYVEFVMGIMEECYRRLEPHEVSYVDLYLFGDAARMRAFFSTERLDLGVALKGFEDPFTAQHDAWRGTSRISICIDKLGSLPKEVQVGTIRHEVGHSVLHGSMEYYVIPIALVTSTAAKSEMPEEFARSFLYLISIAAKDYEVTRLLFLNGYVEDQIAYAKNSIGTTEDDKLAWGMSRNNPAAKAMCIFSRLKEVCCVAPFLVDKRFGDALLDCLARSMSYMGDQTVKKVLFIATQHLPKLGDDTIRNIGLLSDLALKTFPCR